MLHIWEYFWNTADWITAVLVSVSDAPVTTIDAGFVRAISEGTAHVVSDGLTRTIGPV
jgi:hypothetical protein